VFIYLANPYSIDAPVSTEYGRNRRIRRYWGALEVLAKLTKDGYVVFSPIVHSHQLHIAFPDLVGDDWEFWERIDRAFISCCAKVIVIKMEGWDRSIGVQAEIKYATEIGKPVEYMEVE
jgi:hypothetical protein